MKLAMETTSCLINYLEVIYSDMGVTYKYS